MKAVITLAAILLATGVSQAKTVCNLNTTSTGEGTTFDQILHTAEVSTTQYVVVDTDRRSAKEVQLTDFDSAEKLNRIDKMTLVAFNPKAGGGSASITASQIDMSNLQGNALPLQAMATGPIGEKAGLTLYLPSQKLWAVCFKQK